MPELPAPPDPLRKREPVHVGCAYGGERDAVRLGVADLASTQWGYVGSWQLRLLGVPKSMRDSWVRTEWLLPRFRGSYAVGHRPRLLRADFAAAVLAVGEDAALSHISAALLWGLLRIRQAHVDVSKPRNGRHRDGILVHRSPSLAGDVTRRFNIPVTTPEETIVGLGGVLRKDDYLLRAVNQALVDDLLTLDSLHEHVDSAGNRAGTRRIRDLLEVAGRARSFLEDGVVADLAGTGIESNFVIAGDEVDLYDPVANAVLEIDGDPYHGNPIAQLLDARKTERLRRRGLTVARARSAPATPPPAPGTGSSSRGGRSGGRP